MDRPFSAYQGDEPYIFVSYAHEDDETVYPEIQWLKDQGFNIWYDEGISAGKNWRAEIGDSLLKADYLLFYISKASLTSEHCLREISLALDEGKKLSEDKLCVSDIIYRSKVPEHQFSEFTMGLSSV